MGEHESNEVVENIALQVADGAAVDWPSAREQAVEKSRDAVEHLRAIAEIARVHRGLLREGAPAAPALTPPSPDGVPWGPLLVFEKLGSGAFGDVFRAWDTSLQREVALKLLRSHAGGTADAAVQEGHRLARVSHPNVMAVYGAQRVGSQVGIWGELLHGKTLAALIADQGPLGADETLIAGESICRALGAVHRTGMLHRDVKAQNVFREKGGRLVLMDFGLGRELDAAVASGELAGTPVYLAPELFDGGHASVQSDIYSVGVLLFFLATDAFPVSGASLDDIRRAHRDGRRARLQDLRPELPRQFVQVVERALDPDPSKRYQSAGAMQTALARAVQGDDARLEHQGGGRVGLASLALACLAVAVIVGVIVWTAWHKTPSAPPQVARFEIVPPPAQSLDIQDNDRNIAIAPDGRHFVYRSGGTSSGGPLMLRAMDQLDARSLPGITNGRGPFFSPDGRFIGFFDGNELKKISVSGEPAATICRFSDYPRGASWGDDNTIVFATNGEGGGLWRVSANGGTPVQLTTSNASQQERFHWFPFVLPGSRGVLFTINQQDQRTMQIAVLDYRTRKYRTLIRNASQAEYVPPPPGSRDPGYLVYVAASALRVVRFDLDSLEPVGDSAQVVEHLKLAENGAANYAIAGMAALVYLVSEREPPRSLVWVSRDGRASPITTVPDRPYAVPRISPDGRRVVVEVRATDDDLSVWDSTLNRFDKLALGAGFERSAVWSANGRRVLFASAADKAGPYHLFARNANGSGSIEQVSPTADLHPTSSTTDGWIIANRFVKGRASIARVKPGRDVEPLVDESSDQRNGQISPDGRYIAYQSNESGRTEVHVRPYPNVKDGHWQVSTDGGSGPMWAHNELFFLDRDSIMTAVPVFLGAGQFSHGDATKLFGARTYASDGDRAYDVSPDGSRFLFIKDGPAKSSSTASAILVVFNWFEEIRSKLVPAGR